MRSSDNGVQGRGKGSGVVEGAIRERWRVAGGRYSFKRIVLQ